MNNGIKYVIMQLLHKSKVALVVGWAGWTTFVGPTLVRYSSYFLLFCIFKQVGESNIHANRMARTLIHPTHSLVTSIKNAAGIIIKTIA